jgi:hypothetical protein
VRLTSLFAPTQLAQLEVDLLPTGLFGVQDGRTLRRNKPGQGLVSDQKTTQPPAADLQQAAQDIERTTHMLLAVLPLLGYRVEHLFRCRPFT